MLVFQSVLGRHIADGAVEPDRVVVLDELGGGGLSLIDVQGSFDPKAVTLERAVPALDLAVAFRVMRRSPHVGQLSDADELLEDALALVRRCRQPQKVV